MSQARIERLRQLVRAIAEGRTSGEFTMRVPAEPDRDADLVISWAAGELERLQAQTQWQKFEDILPREGAFILAGHPKFGTNLKPMQRNGLNLYRARAEGLQKWRREDLVTQVGSPLLPLWRYMPDPRTAGEGGQA